MYRRESILIETDSPTIDPTERSTDDTATAADLSGMRAALAATQQDLSQALASIEDLTAERDDLAARSVEAEALATQRLIATHRRALLAENRGQVIDELVTGTTPEELEASVETAKAAYTRVMEAVRARTPLVLSVPAGASPRSEVPAEDLSPIQKITSALSRSRR
jgi:hypothetical protein